MILGLISDTHGHFDPRIPRLFAGVDHILHAGDIGSARVIQELEAIAPVTAVLGNNDFDPAWRETEVVTLGGWKFLVHHIVGLRTLSEVLQRRLEIEQPDVVVFGHTHQPHEERRDGRLFVNPGYAGKPRFGMDRSVALLHGTEAELRVEFRPL